MNPRKTGDIAESPLASELPDFAALDSDIDRAAEFISDAIASYGKTLEGTPRTVFENNAIKVLAGPFAKALQDAAQSEASLDHSEFIAGLLGHINATKDPYLALRCLPIIFDLPTGGESEQDLADDFGIGRAAVSALCVELRLRLRVPPGRGMRRDETRQKYAERQSGRRAKPLPSPWPFRGIMARVKLSLTA